METKNINNSFLKKVICYFLLCFIFLIDYSFGQENQNKPTYTVNIEKRDTAIKCEVLYEKQNFIPKEDQTYYWFASNKILNTQGGYDGRLLDGSYNSYYPNKNLKEKGLFKKGVKTGKGLYWHGNGKISEVIHWENGKKNGEYEAYNEEGVKLINATFKNDKLNGRLSTYQDGQIVASAKYKNGVEIIKKKNEEAPEEKKEKAKKKTKSTDSSAQSKPKKKPFFKNLFKKKEKKEEPKKDTKEKDKPKLHLLKHKKDKPTESTTK